VEAVPQSSAMDPKGNMTTTLLLNFELPALGVSAQISWTVRPSRQSHILDCMDEMVQVIQQEFADDLASVDREGSTRTMEHFRSKAMKDIDEWQNKLKMAEEWKTKVDRAGNQMNRMRNDYYKELSHLREQIHQKQHCEKTGQEYTPVVFNSFDPGSYSLEETHEELKEELKKEKKKHDSELKEVEKKYNSRINMLHDQLATTKMILSRKEKLLDQVQQQVAEKQKAQETTAPAQATVDPSSSPPAHGATTASVASGELAATPVSEPQPLATDPVPEGEAPAARTSYNKRQTKSVSGAKGFGPDMKAKIGKLQQKAKHAANLADVGDHSPVPAAPPQVMEEFRKHLCSKFGSLDEAQTHLSLLYKIDEEIGYASFEKLLVELTFKGDPEKAFHCFSQGKSYVTVEIIFKRLNGEATGDKHSEDGASDSDRDSFVSGDDNQGRFSHQSRRRGSVTVKKVGNAVKMLGLGGKKKKVDQNTLTNVTLASGTEAAWSSQGPGEGSMRETQETGTDALPFEAAFPKVKRISRACQSFVDGRMLDQAEKFLDKVAEDNWNMLAGIDYSDSDEDGDQGKDRPSLHTNATEGGPDAGAGGSDAGDLLADVTKTAGEDKSGGSRSASKRASAELQGGGAQTDSKGLESNTDGSWAEPVTSVACGTDVAIMPSVRKRPDAKATASHRGDTRDVEIQCLMTRVVLLSPLEKWLPSDTDPHEAQLQQILDMAWEIEERLPQMRTRAQKLAVEAKGSSEKEKALVEQLQKLGLSDSGMQAGALGKVAGLGADTKGKAKAAVQQQESLAGMLNRHGIKAGTTSAASVAENAARAAAEVGRENTTFTPEPVGRHTFGSGDVSKRSRRVSANGRPLPSAAAARQAAAGPPPGSASGARPGNSQPRVLVPDGGGLSDSDDEAPHWAKGMPAQNAKPVNAMDSMRTIESKARRRSLEKADSGGKESGSVERSPRHVGHARTVGELPDLAPGWSGLVPEPSFSPRGVPIEREATEAVADPQPRAPSQNGGSSTSRRYLRGTSVKFDRTAAEDALNNDRDSFFERGTGSARDSQPFERASFDGERQTNTTQRDSFVRATFDFDCESNASKQDHGTSGSKSGRRANRLASRQSSHLSHPDDESDYNSSEEGFANEADLYDNVLADVGDKEADFPERRSRGTGSRLPDVGSRQGSRPSRDPLPQVPGASSAVGTIGQTSPSSSSGAGARSQMMSLPDEAGMAMRTSNPHKTCPPKPNMLDLRKAHVQKGGVIRGPATAGSTVSEERNTVGSAAGDATEESSGRGTWNRQRHLQRKGSTEDKDTGSTTHGERRTVGTTPRAQRKQTECSDETANSVESGRRPSSARGVAAAVAAAKLSVSSPRPTTPGMGTAGGGSGRNSASGACGAESPHPRRAHNLQPLEHDRTSSKSAAPFSSEPSTPVVVPTDRGHQKSNGGFTGSVAASAAARSLALVGNTGGEAPAASHGPVLVPTAPSGPKAASPAPRKVVTKKLRQP